MENLVIYYNILLLKSFLCLISINSFLNKFSNFIKDQSQKYINLSSVFLRNRKKLRKILLLTKGFQAYQLRRGLS